MAKSNVKVELHGAAGTRETTVQPKGFSTRHIKRDGVSSVVNAGITTPEPEPKPIPTANELFAVYLPRHIMESRWGLYIDVADTRIIDNTVLVYEHPSEAFWNLRDRAKKTFDELGIYVKKSKGVWQARIPIPVLTDKVFYESGLAAIVERGRDAEILEKISTEIRNHQFDRTQRSLHKIYRKRNALRDAAGDVAGLGAIVVLGWLFYIVM